MLRSINIVSAEAIHPHRGHQAERSSASGAGNRRPFMTRRLAGALRWLLRLVARSWRRPQPKWCATGFQKYGTLETGKVGWSGYHGFLLVSRQGGLRRTPPLGPICAFLCVGLHSLEMPTCFTWNGVGRGWSVAVGLLTTTSMAHSGGLGVAIRCALIEPVLRASCRTVTIGAQVDSFRNHCHASTAGRLAICRVHMREESFPASTAGRPLFW